MSIEAEINKVLDKHQSRNSTLFVIRSTELVSDLAALMEREPSETELISLLQQYTGFTHCIIDSRKATCAKCTQLLKEMISWAKSGSMVRPKRKQIEEVLRASNIRTQEDMKETVDSILSLLDGQPSKRWCEHIVFRDDKWGIRSGGVTIFNIHACKVNDWKLCPICGSPRPVEAK